MPLFNWPYTNLHNLNLDWIIKKIKNVETAETNTAASEEAAAGSAASAAESEENAAASETNAAASATAAGNYYNQIRENVSTLVTGWMDEHIKPTTPPVDDTLTIKGAAADAKKTGDGLTDLKNAIGIEDHILYDGTDTQYYGTMPDGTSFYHIGTLDSDCRLTGYYGKTASGALTYLIVLRNNKVIEKVNLGEAKGSYRSVTLNIECKRGDEIYIGGSNLSFEYRAMQAGIVIKEFPDANVGDTVTVTTTTSTKFNYNLKIEYETSLFDAEEEPPVFHQKWLPKGLQISPNMLRYTEIDKPFGLVGRWYKQTVGEKLCFVTNNCGSELYFKTNGASSVTIDWQSMTNTNAYYVFIIDDTAEVRRNITNKVINLPDTGEHYVRVITDGITENIGKWENGTGFAFASITPNAGSVTGVLPSNPIIMFFGDSITEGIRALGIDDTDMGNTNSATGAFPWFCCKALNAVPFRVGYGATGIDKTGSFNTAINALKYLYNNVPVPKYYPDAIVINYGTNDTDATAFETGLVEYLNAMHLMYPGVKIYVMIPFNQHYASKFRTIISTLEYCTLIETADWTGITYADGTHLLKAGAEVAGNYLYENLLTDIYS